MTAFDQLGALYLGRVCDPASGETTAQPLLYDSRDLTTHAMCVGMTGSGKTGLCIALLEEAGIDGIPAIVIDPKGDLSNLLLTFPGLRPADFEPWVDPGEAERNTMSAQQFAAHTAKIWKEGLAQWGQDGSRIARLRDACDLAIYTPGSRSGRPVSVLRSLTAPGADEREDADSINDRVQALVAGLLSLLGIDADPLRSREQILLANLVGQAWGEGRDYALAGLVADIQSPPFDRLGVMDLESFFPAKERFELAMALNNVLAAPGFDAWMAGEPLNISRLLYTLDGKPRISILSIAHLSERERMFFVTVVLNAMVGWIRSQSGTSSLRAVLYMDEVFGYLPPTAKPPSKQPLLTLLKQARAHGLGVVLATQNPADLDYKSLSNMGTWFLGRLQTERDKARVLDGLAGAARGPFDRAETNRLLSGLEKRQFLMSNVHDERPVLFHSRWALSYLRGPLTRGQISRLAEGSGVSQPLPEGAVGPPPGDELERATAGGTRTVLPAGISERFVALAVTVSAGSRVVYRPRLIGRAELHYANARAGIDHWTKIHLTVPLQEPLAADIWAGAEILESPPRLQEAPDSAAVFAELPAAAARAKSYTQWSKKLKTALYRDHPLRLLQCKALKRVAQPGQSEGEFRAELSHHRREQRDDGIEKLRKRYAPKLARLEERIAAAQLRLEREQSQADQQTLQTAISVGSTLLGALFGRKSVSGRSATRSLRGAGRVISERDDVARAQERLAGLRAQLNDMEDAFEAAIEKLSDQRPLNQLELSERLVRPRKTDMTIDAVMLVWVPWVVDGDGNAVAGFETA